MLRTVTTSQGHPDEFAWLRHVVGETDDLERRRLDRHLGACPACVARRAGMERLDGALRLYRDAVLGPVPSAASGELTKGDPFAVRPKGTRRLPSAFGLRGEDVARLAQAAARLAGPLKVELLDSAGSVERLTSILEALRLELLEARYALGYALDEAPKRIVEGAARWGRLGEAAGQRLAREPYVPFSSAPAEGMGLVELAYPLAELLARAALLRGIAAGWTGDFPAGGRALQEAYRFFGEGKGVETSLATVELHEAQRRCFAGEASSALPLARRAVDTFATWRLPDDHARARYAEAVCLYYLDRDAEAIPIFQETAAAFAQLGLWMPYVTAVNGAGSCMQKLGNLDSARREYAKALRRTSAASHPTSHALLSLNLARLLLAAGRLPDAVTAFRRSEQLLEGQEMLVDALTARLYRVEALARMGRRGEAAQLVSEMRETLASEQDVEATLRSIAHELASDDLSLDRLFTLREEAEDTLRRVLRA